MAACRRVAAFTLIAVAITATGALANIDSKGMGDLLIYASMQP